MSAPPVVSVLAVAGRRRGVIAAGLVLALISTGASILRGGRASDRRPAAAAPTPLGTSVALSSSCPPSTSTDPLVLDIAGFAYCPATVTVALGDEVVWTNADLAPHTVTYDSPDGPVDSGSMVEGQAWSTRFGPAGTYRSTAGSTRG